MDVCVCMCECVYAVGVYCGWGVCINAYVVMCMYLINVN